MSRWCLEMFAVCYAALLWGQGRYATHWTHWMILLLNCCQACCPMRLWMEMTFVQISLFCMPRECLGACGTGVLTVVLNRFCHHPNALLGIKHSWFLRGFQQEHASEFMSILSWPAKNYLPTVAIGSERSERVSHYPSSGLTIQLDFPWFSWWISNQKPLLSLYPEMPQPRGPHASPDSRPARLARGMDGHPKNMWAIGLWNLLELANSSVQSKTNWLCSSAYPFLRSLGLVDQKHTDSHFGFLTSGT